MIMTCIYSRLLNYPVAKSPSNVFVIKTNAAQMSSGEPIRGSLGIKNVLGRCARGYKRRDS